MQFLQLKIEKALEHYKKGGMSLARVAELAGISIREMIPLASAQGLEPKDDDAILKSELTPETARTL